MKKLFFDYETGCQCDLKKHGRARYVSDPSMYIQIASWAVDDGPIQTWTCHDGPFPVEIFSGCTLYAFNAAFEIAVTRQIFGLDLTSQTVDVQGLCGRYGLPQSLEKATEILCPDNKKDSAGTALIRQFSGATPEQCCGPDWDAYVRYNIQDVESMRTLVRHLPADRLSPREQAIWELNADINRRGLPIAEEEARCILETTQRFMEEQNQRLPEITGGMVEKVTQVLRIKNFVNKTMGYELIESLNKEQLENLMDSEQWGELPAAVVQVLEMRAALGLSSVGKYKRIVDMEVNGRMYDNSRYYGAHTGRITGMGFQLLNLPRASVDDVEGEIQFFLDGSIMAANPVKSARALIRSMIKPQPGKVIMCADYSSIEYVILVWLAGDTEAMQRFAADFSPYKDMASYMYQVSYDEVTKDQRQTGKVGILGCGYAMGAGGFVAYAGRFKVFLTLEEAQTVVAQYRRKYRLVVIMWYALMDCAKRAVGVPGKTFTTHRVSFRVTTDRAGSRWLCVTIPSGRTLYYRDPHLSRGDYGTTLTYMGTSQTTKTYCRQYSSPGKLTENIVQALGRDILYDGKFELVKNGFSIVGSVYDENICEEVDQGSELNAERLALMERCMTQTQEWSAGLPLRADGWVNNRYKK